MRLRLPLLGPIIAAAVLILDQLSKYVIVEKVMRPAGVTGTPFLSDKVIGFLPVLNLRLAWNYGISFSLFNSGTPAAVGVLLVLEIAITAGLVWYLLRAEGAWMKIALGLMVGGALGTIVDRVTLGGAVVDFLDFHWQEWHFPTFNLSDSSITVGVILWLLDGLGLAPHHKGAPEPHKD